MSDDTRLDATVHRMTALYEATVEVLDHVHLNRAELSQVPGGRAIVARSDRVRPRFATALQHPHVERPAA